MKNTSINISQISTGFIEIPDQITLNIYAQGCEKNCKGCHNPEQRKFEGGEKIFLTDIPNLLSKYYLSEWVCWLGGDATYQPESLISFNNEFKKHKMKIALYTGRCFSELSNKILESVDLVIDGEWKGVPVTEPGTNQTIMVKSSTNNWDIISSWGDLEVFLKKHCC